MQKLYRVKIKAQNYPSPNYESEYEELNFGTYNEAISFIELFNKHINIYRKIIMYKHKAFRNGDLAYKPEEFISGVLQEEEYKPFCFGHMSPFFIERAVRSEVTFTINEVFVIYGINDDCQSLVSANIECSVCGKKSIIREYEKHEIVPYKDMQFLIACKYNKCSICSNSYVTYENYNDDKLSRKYDELSALFEKYEESLNEIIKGPLFDPSDNDKKSMSSTYTC